MAELQSDSILMRNAYELTAQNVTAIVQYVPDEKEYIGIALVGNQEIAYIDGQPDIKSVLIPLGRAIRIAGYWREESH